MKTVKKVLFLGDMFELGNVSDEEHQNIVDFLTHNQIGRVFLVGKNFYKTNITGDLIEKLETFEDLKAAITAQPPTNATILIKGSRGMALERILELI